MKKGIYILFLVPVLAFGQQDSNVIKRAYVGAGGGLSLAPRKLFNSASNSLWMDYLNPGYTISAFGQVRLGHSHIGITGSFTSYSNSFDINKYMNANRPDATATVTSVSYGGFSQFSFLLGAYYTFALHKLSFELRAMGGIDYLRLPNNEIDVNNPPSEPEYTLTMIYTSNIGIAADGGISIAYPIGKSLLAKLNLDYFMANIGYSYTSYKDYIIHIDYTKNYPVAGADVFTFNTTLSLCYGFGK